jgi:hypothetical protein
MNASCRKNNLSDLKHRTYLDTNNCNEGAIETLLKAETAKGMSHPRHKRHTQARPNRLGVSTKGRARGPNAMEIGGGPHGSCLAFETSAAHITYLHNIAGDFIASQRRLWSERKSNAANKL